MKKVLITGIAGFIGFHTAKRLLAKGWQVVGIDNLNAYYDPQLKTDRLAELGIHITPENEQQKIIQGNLSFVKTDLADKEALIALFAEEKFDMVVHLAAQAGVRYSVESPDIYISSNIQGFFHLLECCRRFPVQHLLTASSSSVYGKEAPSPSAEEADTDHPASLYAATKKSNEVMAYAYASLYHIPVTCLRLFTVYGPWGRPDMALFIFTDAILQGKPLPVFGGGNMLRDFTFVEDVTESIGALLDHPAEGKVPYRVLNIGRGKTLLLSDFIGEIERQSGKVALREHLPVQAGDVPATFADTSALQELVGKTPETSLEEGIRRFLEWYIPYYAIH